MVRRFWPAGLGGGGLLVALMLGLAVRERATDACCPAGRAGSPVVNADQTVIMVWDAEKKVQHFIRQASFRSQADDVGFLVPTPSIPELEEAGNEAFRYLGELTAPEVVYQRRPRGGGCACAAIPPTSAAPEAAVVVLAEKRVAGFDAQVLEATSAKELVDWLNQHGYEFSPEVREWAEPYVRDGWKFTALKVAREPAAGHGGEPGTRAGKGAPDARETQAEEATQVDQATEPGASTIAGASTEGNAAASQAPPGKLEAAALRISFRTERPLFPYREPDPSAAAQKLNAHFRLLRIFFVSDARYQGELTAEEPWTGHAAWAGRLTADQRTRLLDELRLPTDAAPRDAWLTELEHVWPYRAAPADVYFTRAPLQREVRRPADIRYVSDRSGHDLWPLTAVALLLWRRRRGKSTS